MKNEKPKFYITYSSNTTREDLKIEDYINFIKTLINISNQINMVKSIDTRGDGHV